MAAICPEAHASFRYWDAVCGPCGSQMSSTC